MRRRAVRKQQPVGPFDQSSKAPHEVARRCVVGPLGGALVDYACPGVPVEAEPREHGLAGHVRVRAVVRQDERVRQPGSPLLEAGAGGARLRIGR